MNQSKYITRTLQAVSLLVSLGMGGSISAVASNSSATSDELLVRFYEPQNSTLQALGQVRGVLGMARPQLKVVNSEQGVVKLKFSSPAEMAVAIRQLESSGRVASVSRNHLYRPALNAKITLRQDAQAEQAESAMPFLLPFFPSVVGKIPDVLLPTTPAFRGLDPLEAQDWAMANIRIPALSQLSPSVATITTAVIDTGVDYNHEDLIHGMWRSAEDPLEVGYDFAHDVAKPFDLVHFDIEGCLKDTACSVLGQTQEYLVNPGHGTHCAGHVGAVANNSLGMRGVGAGNGRIQASKMMALKFFYDVGELNAGAGDDAAAVKSIDYAVKNGAKVISASWGGYQAREDAEKSELKQSLIRARDAGVLVVIAAGNGDSSGAPVNLDSAEEPCYPAAYELDNIITVAAIDSKDQIAEFSNYGAKTVHIAAPGVKILSTTSGGKYSDLVTSYKDSRGGVHEIEWSGTSMATPIVAGAAALIWSQHPQWSYAQVRERILSTARKIPALEGMVSTGGTLDLARALE